MSEEQVQLPLQFGGCGSAEQLLLRRERREELVRLVEFCPFPRATVADGWRLGSTRNLSASGMCLEVEAPVPKDSLLRFTIRRIDGRPTLAGLARVAWCTEGPDGATRVGLEIPAASPRRLARVRPRGSGSVRHAA